MDVDINRDDDICEGRLSCPERVSHRLSNIWHCLCPYITLGNNCSDDSK